MPSLKGERYCPTPFWKLLGLTAVISCSQVQSSTGPGRHKDSFDDIHDRVVHLRVCACMNTYNHGVHKRYCRSLDFHSYSLESGLEGVSLNGCQISRSAHKDPNTQGCPKNQNLTN